MKVVSCWKSLNLLITKLLVLLFIHVWIFFDAGQGFPSLFPLRTDLRIDQVSQNFSWIWRGSQSHVFALFNMCVWQSRFMYEALSESRFFWGPQFICLNGVFSISSFDFEFQWSNLQIHSQKKFILTSPKFSEFHKKLQNLYCNLRFSTRKTGIFVLGYQNVVYYNRITSSSQFEEAG